MLANHKSVKYDRPGDIILRLDRQTTNNIVSLSTNQDNDQRLIPSTDESQFTLTLMMTFAQVVEMSVNSDLPIIPGARD